MENADPRIIKPNPISTNLVIKDNKLLNITKQSVFELIRNIKDPEHPYSLEQLNVVSLDDINIGCISNNDIECQIVRSFEPIKFIEVVFTPTVPHCSMAGIIGLCIRRRLESLIQGVWIKILVKEGYHSNSSGLNKQLNDKDRVMAAFENEDLLDILDSCINGLTNDN